MTCTRALKASAGFTPTPMDIRGDMWMASERCYVKIGRQSPKVAEALLVALPRSFQQCGRGAALSLEGCLVHPTLATIETSPVLEEPSLAELPPTSGELKEVWDRSTGLPMDPEVSQKHDGKRGISCYSLVSSSHSRLKSVVNRPTSTKATKVLHRYGPGWLLWKHHTALAR